MNSSDTFKPGTDILSIEDPDLEFSHPSHRKLHEPFRSESTSDSSFVLEESTEADEYELQDYNAHSQRFSVDEEIGSKDDYGDETKVYEFEGHLVVENSKNILTSRKLKFQVMTIYASFMIFGMSDQTLGTIMQQLLDTYHIDRSQASLLFISQVVGYFVASMFNGFTHSNFGFFGAYVCAQTFQILCFLIYFMRPPFAVLIAASVMNGYGVGTYDSACSLWVSQLKYSNEIMGLMHAFFGLGSMISPFAITKMLHWGLSWNVYYLVLALGDTGTLISCILVFRDETKWKFRRRLAESSSDPQGTTWDAIKTPQIWFYATTLFIYCGGELTVGVWMYNYYTTILHLSDSYSSYITSGYWTALTAGRAILAFVTGRYFDGREHIATLIYAGLGAITCTLYAVLPNFPLRIASMLAFGFFVGPAFGTTVMVAMRFLPPSLQSSGLGFIAGLGGMGGTVMPYIVGYVSEHTAGGNGQGLVYFPGLCAISFVFAFLLWIGFNIQKRGKSGVAYERL
ncbi:unnamed protein product [Kuraishia capsulata CBS 1993]|uniref:Major facilitator superfamily (MFS) profile domain-containing protein n=1 Tax=Kuraishia capsulata CBS 1993 TaxID=1382522 RepID=W6MII9_9ASCO|nr:uncharacterized protein KUCA_T00001693001 [Kuraishia capsulata CBS 1993]CDK25723.1 unnamed protein product [Kuraishia capsulata CBS 1993]